MNVDGTNEPLDRAELHARWRAQLAEIDRLEAELAQAEEHEVEPSPRVSRRTLLQLAAGGAAAATVGMIGGTTPAFAGDSPFIGSIELFAGTFAPVGWVFCDGALYNPNPPADPNATDYSTLYQLIGTTYGGDGSNTFAVPDLRGRVPIGQGTDGLTGYTYGLGQVGGLETVALSTQELPPHTHSAFAHTTGGNSISPAGNYWARSTTGDRAYSSSTPDSAMNNASITSAGGGGPHDNVQPYLAINFIIAVFGIYPTQN